MRRLLVAVRDLDPPGGGAERSLAALINGLARPGPVASTAPEFLPAVPAETVDTHDAWEVRALSSKSRGAATDLLDEAVKAERLALPIEGPWSRAAWALRQRGGSRRPRHWAHRRHLVQRNKQFATEVGQWLSSTGPGIGLTQLDWAAGAASAFKAAGVPWMVFVRDEIVFRFPPCTARRSRAQPSSVRLGKGCSLRLKGPSPPGQSQRAFADRFWWTLWPPGGREGSCRHGTQGKTG